MSKGISVSKSLGGLVDVLEERQSNKTLRLGDLPALIEVLKQIKNVAAYQEEQAYRYQRLQNASYINTNLNTLAAVFDAPNSNVRAHPALLKLL